MRKTIHIPASKPTTVCTSLEEIEAIAAQNEYAAFSVVGDCMEGAGINDGDVIHVCFTRFPRPPKHKSVDGFSRSDACLCWYSMKGRSMLGVKEYVGVWGTMQEVGTRYKCVEGEQFRMNWAVSAKRIFGVVYACYDGAGHLKWGHDLNDFPTELGTQPTIRGGNVGDPIPISA